MKELEILQEGEIKADENLAFFISDEQDISCVNLPELKRNVQRLDKEIILVLPSHQVQKGKRGFAKAQIVNSFSDRIKGVVPLDIINLDEESEHSWQIVRFSTLINEQQVEVKSQGNIQILNLPIMETAELIDIEMLSLARKAVEKSNCWLDPAGCVFVKEGKIVLESTSQGKNNPICKKIPFEASELQLSPGERMHFCSSVHAEVVGVKTARENGISLEESSIYITKFPCRPCSEVIIEAGISRVYFDQPSYGMADANLLIENGIKLFKVTS